MTPMYPAGLMRPAPVRLGCAAPSGEAATRGNSPTGADFANGAADEAAEPASNDPHVSGGADAAGAGAAGTCGVPSSEATDVVVDEAAELADDASMPAINGNGPHGAGRTCGAGWLCLAGALSMSMSGGAAASKYQ
jgi:hypothetical protein